MTHASNNIHLPSAFWVPGTVRLVRSHPSSVEKEVLDTTKPQGKQAPQDPSYSESLLHRPALGAPGSELRKVADGAGGRGVRVRQRSPGRWMRPKVRDRAVRNAHLTWPAPPSVQVLLSRRGRGTRGLGRPAPARSRAAGLAGARLGPASAPRSRADTVSTSPIDL